MEGSNQLRWGVTPPILFPHILLLFAYFFVLIAIPLSARGAFLNESQVVSYGDEGIEGLNNPNSLVISPDGRHVYVTSYYSNGVTVFRRNNENGKLSFIELESHRDGADDGLYRPEKISISPDGEHVYVTSTGANSLAVFDRNSSTGEISFAGYYDRYPRVYDASAVKVTPDGKYVIVTLEINGEVIVYQRDLSTGLLEFTGSYQFGTLWDFTDVDISFDSKNFYVTDSYHDELYVFSLDTSDGSSEGLQTFTDGEGSLDGLNGAQAVSSSPDGGSVYVASPADFAISVFDRNASDGKLSYVEVQRAGVDGVDGLDGVSHVTVSSDGRYVYACGTESDAVAIFQRNLDESTLSFIEVVKHEDSAVSALLSPVQSVVSSDGAYLYVVSPTSDSVTVFQTSSDSVPPPTPNDFKINAGLNGSWFYPGKSGQGFLIDVFPDSKILFAAWFTFDTIVHDDSVGTGLGHPSQRWLTAQGQYSGNEAILDLYSTSAGIFDTYPPVPSTDSIGTITFEFSDCNTATVTYDIPSIGRQGVIPIQRIVTENVPLCESLNEMMFSE